MADPAVPDVAAVVVTYDALPWLERCLESLRGVDTVVVDNGSTDGTVDLVRDRFPDVALLEQKNLGLAAGWARGIEATRGRYVLLLNSDAWLVEDALARLVAVAERHQFLNGTLAEGWRADEHGVGPRGKIGSGRGSDPKGDQSGGGQQNFLHFRFPSSFGSNATARVVNLRLLNI